MATRPQQLSEATQRRHSQQVIEQETQIPSPASRPRSPSQVRSQASDDSQTVLLSHSDARIQIEASVTSQGEECLHCWICLMEEPRTEFEVGNWKEPCSCNLTAHEDCLFQWIASQEDDRKIQCPQCKTTINISQPTDYFLDFASTARRAAGNLVAPAGVAAVLGITYTGLLIYGQNTVTLIFGAKEARRMFASAFSQPQAVRLIRGDTLWDAIRSFTDDLENKSWRLFKRIMALACPFFPNFEGEMNWKCLASLPLVAPALVMSRVHVADDLFTLIPAAYSVFQVLSKSPQDILEWPPSPGLTLAILPIFRIGYNETFKYFFLDLEKKWTQAVKRQPREGETAEEVAQAEADREERHELEVGIELGPAEEADMDDEGTQINEIQGQLLANAQRQAELLNRIQERLDLQDAENAAGLGGEHGLHNLRANLGLAQRNQQVVHDAQENLNWEHPELIEGQQPEQNAMPEPVAARANAIEGRFNLVTDGLATTVIGALFFPAISWAMGSLIKISLPKTWVKEPYLLRSWRGSEKLSWSKGFLQTQFGRSIAGGCLFIVLKDAAVLYYKWKRAKDIGKRRIMNYREKSDVRKRNE